MGSTAVGDAAAKGRGHMPWPTWWAHLRCLVAAALLPCRPALSRPRPCRPAAPGEGSSVTGTLFLPSTGDRRVRLFLHEAPPGEVGPAEVVVLDLPAGLSRADIAAAGRVVLECERSWAGGGGALLEVPRWLVYCNGRRAGFAGRRERATDAEGWVLEKLRAVAAGAGRLPGGAVQYFRGRFETIVGSDDAVSFHLVEPIGVLGGGGGGLSIFFHRV